MFNKSTIGIDGRHRISLCDVRIGKGLEMEKEIERFLQTEEMKARALKIKIFGLKKEILETQSSLGIKLKVPMRFVLEDEIQALRIALRQLNDKKHLALTQMYKTLREIAGVNVFEVHNIIPTVGRSVIARWIIGDNTYNADDGADWGSLGTSNTAVSNSDTQLTAESFRKARSSQAQSSNVAYLSNFYTATEVTGTFEEAGWHIDATASANSGQLLSHFLTGTISKSATETLTVESTLAIN